MPVKTLDLRGEVCPYTFVRTKLLLEELERGDELDVYLDHPAAFSTVPRSLELEGHEVLLVERTPDGREARVRVKKGGG